MNDPVLNDDAATDDPSAIGDAAVPFHGFARPDEDPSAGYRPPLTVAISRATGARGSSIAARLGELLDRQVYTQEAFDYMTGTLGMESGTAELEPAALAWFERHWAQVQDSAWLRDNPALGPMVRTVLVLAAAGGGIIVGRGAGCLLPRSVRLFARLIAPEEQRVAFVAQWQRSSADDARAYVRERDRRREEFVRSRFGRSTDDLLQYDMVVDTSHFGVDGTAAIVAAAVRERERYRSRTGEPPR
jgi:hypothetical protein